MNVKKLTTLAMYTTIALTIFYLESLLPPIVPIPGVKLGLSNIVTLIILMNYSSRDAIMVTIARLLLSCAFAGSVIMFFYSFAGSMLSLLIMIPVHKIAKNSHIYITSITGALFHNAGQILAAVILTSTFQVIAYYPILVVSGVITGLFTGFAAYYAQKHIVAHINPDHPNSL